MLMTALGVVALVITLVDTLRYPTREYGYWPLVTSILFTAGNAVLASVREPKRWMKQTQAGLIMAVGIMAAFLSDPATYGGMVMVAIGIAMLAKARTFTRPYQIVLVMCGAIAADFVYGILADAERLASQIGVSAVSLGAFGIIYYAFYSELNSALISIQELEKSNSVRDRVINALEYDLRQSKATQENASRQAVELSRKVRRLSGQLEELNDKYSPVNLQVFEITPREEEVLQSLVLTRGRNRDIAEQLGITERTVKAHVHNICDKVGVDTRLELAELFRYNWETAEAESLQETRS
jgi:DNA-binding CsgD family transcriptional regulator